MKRGDVVLIDFPFSDGRGHKLRPAVIVQANAITAAIDDLIVVLVTRTRRQMPTEVLVDPATPAGIQSGLRHASIADCKNLLTVDKSFIHVVIGELGPAILTEIDSCLKVRLDLS